MTTREDAALERMADSGLQEAREMRPLKLRNIPRRQFLDPLPPSAHVVHRCRVCGFTAEGWCALSDPRIVVGLCLDCYGASEGARAPRVMAKNGPWVPHVKGAA